MRTFAARLLPTLPLLFALGACGTLVGNPEDDEDEGASTSPNAIVTPSPDFGNSAAVTFSLTDAPLDAARSVFVTVESLQVTTDGQRWIGIPLTHATEVDLLSYQDGATLELGGAPELPAGTYATTRLVLAANVPPRIVLEDESEHAIVVPDAVKAGIDIATPFTVEAGDETALTIDFDLRKSVKFANGVYTLQPMLRLLRDEETGGVSGNVDAIGKAKVVCAYPAGTTKDADDDCATAANTAKVKGGIFRMAFLPVGSYELRVFYKKKKKTNADWSDWFDLSGKSDDDDGEQDADNYVDILAFEVAPGLFTDLGVLGE